MSLADKKFLTLLATVAAVCGGVCVAGADPPPLIPRKVLFGNPDKARPRISPDGRRLTYLAPFDGVLNVWVRTLGQKDDHPVTHDRGRGVRSYWWAQNSRQILYIQDKDGDENWHVFCVDLDSGAERNLTPFDGAQAWLTALEPARPDEILVAINKRDPQHRDVYRVHLSKNDMHMVVKNREGFIHFLADHELRVRAAVKATESGGLELKVRKSPEASWETLITWSAEDAFNSGPIAFTPDNDGLYMISSAGCNVSELRRLNLSDGKETTLAADHLADVAEVLIHPLTGKLEGVAFNKERMHWWPLDKSVKKDFSALRRARQHSDFRILDRDHTDRYWIVGYVSDSAPEWYYLYDRQAGEVKPLFSNRRALEDVRLARMVPIGFRARDGLLIPGYLTVPPGVGHKGLPMVLLVNTGPWSRTSWGYDATAQWLANRGYAVLQINFRGSRGYGKHYLNAGNREWGGKIQNDLIDGVRWAIDKGIADPKRIAAFGTSFGGYATLLALTDTPELFACGVDIVGPSNLVTFIENLPPYMKSVQPLIWDRIGHPKKDAEFLKSRSPLYRADRIVKPLLIAQGANDPRVTRVESLQIVEALRDAGKDVEYIEYPDEGHGFARPENRLDFYARAEKFLAKHLGGRFEE